MQFYDVFESKESIEIERLLNFVRNVVRTKLHYKCNRFRLDNTGGNLKFKSLCEDTGIGIYFEFTTGWNPQQNIIVERQFAALWGMIRASLKRSGVN